MAVSVRIDTNLPVVQRLFDRLQRLGANPRPLLEEIAAYGEASTRARFRSQTAPSGEPWTPSLRVRLFGGKTLTRDGHLGDSITHRADDQAAEWGTNRIYAAVHQFGGEIKAVTGRHLRFALPGIGWRSVASVTLPARPFLGLSTEDRREILEMVGDHLRQLLRPGAAGGA